MSTTFRHWRLVVWLLALLVPSAGQTAEQSFPLGRDPYLWSGPRPSPAPLNFRDARDPYRNLVQLVDGGLQLQFLDMLLPNGTQPLVVRRQYRSGLRTEGVFGKGWSSNLDVRLMLSSAGVPRIVEANGYVTTYESVADHYAPVGGAFPAQELRRWGSNWIRQWSDGSTELFDSFGQLAQRTGSNDAARQFYPSFESKLPSAIVDGKAARNIKLTYRDGLLAQIDFPPGRTIRYIYQQRQLVGTIDPIGRQTAFAYTNGRLTTLTLPGGRALTFSYGQNGSLREVAGPGSLGATFAWQASATKPVIGLRVTDRAGSVDALAVAPVAIKRPGTQGELGLQLRRTVDGREMSRAAIFSNMAAIRGNGKTLRLDGRELRVDGPAASAVADLDEWRARFTPALASGRDAALSYDDAGRPVALKLQDGTRETWKWDNADRIVEWADDGGVVSHYEYDLADHLVRVKQGEQVTRSATYNELGLLTHLVTTDGGDTRFTYDAGGRLASVSNMTGTRYEFARDDHGRVAVLYLNGKPTRYFTYDDAGRVARVAAADGGATEYRYLAHGEQVEELDANGGRTSRLYDEKGRLVEATYADGGQVSVKYGDGRIVSIKSADGTSALFEYDSAGRIQRIQLPGKPERRFIYGKDGKLQAISDNNAIVRAFKYDDKGRLLSELDAKKHGPHFAYDSKGRLTGYDLGAENTRLTYDEGGGLSIIERNGKQTSELHYDAKRRLAMYRDPAGTETRYEYDASGLHRIAGPEGDTLDFEHDENGRVTALRHQDGPNIAELKYEYNSAGRISKVVHEDHTTESFSYDDRGRLRERINRAGAVFRYAYDKDDRIQNVTGPFGEEHFKYDGLGRVVEHTDPVEGTFRWSYSNDGNAIVISDPAGARTAVEVSERGDQVKVTDAQGGVVRSTYNDLQQLASSSDADGNTTAFRYDSDGHLVEKTTPAGRAIRYKYNDDRLTETTLPDGSAVKRRYDAAGHMTHLASSGDIAWDYRYDGHGRLAAVHGGAGTASYRYDALDRPIAYRDSAASTVGVIYDVASRPAVVEMPDHQKATYSYNSAGLLGATEFAGLSTRYTYDRSGRLIAIAYPNQTTTSYDYVTGNRIRSIATINADRKVIVGETYEYDTRGNVTAIVSRSDLGALPARADLALTFGRTEYRYDALSRIVEASYPDGSVERFRYDAASNIVEYETEGTGSDGKKYRKTVPYTYAPDQFLRSQNGRPIATDQNGNLCSDKPGDECSAKYDALNRLTAWQGQTYQYDGEGRLTDWRDRAGHGGHFVYFNRLKIAELGVGGEPSRSYVPGIQAGLWSQMRIGANTYFPIRAANGSLIAVTDSSGALVQLCRYRTFSLGVSWSATSAAARCELAGGMQLGPGFWFGPRVLSETGMRFMSPDPLGPDKDGNLYSYALNNPLRFVDPAGTASLPLLPPMTPTPQYLGPILKDIIQVANDPTASPEAREVAQNVITQTKQGTLQIRTVSSIPDENGKPALKTLGGSSNVPGNKVAQVYTDAVLRNTATNAERQMTLTAIHEATHVEQNLVKERYLGGNEYRRIHELHAELNAWKFDPTMGTGRLKTREEVLEKVAKAYADVPGSDVMRERTMIKGFRDGHELTFSEQIQRLKRLRAGEAVERVQRLPQKASVVEWTPETIERRLIWTSEQTESAIEKGAKVANRIEDALAAAEEVGEGLLGRAAEYGGKAAAWLAAKPAVRLAKLLGEAAGEVLMAKDAMDVAIWAGQGIGAFAADIYIATKTHLDAFDDIAKKIAALEDPKKKKARRAELSNRAGPEPLPLHDGIGEPNRPLPGPPAGQPANAATPANPARSAAQPRDHPECGSDYRHLVQAVVGGANPPAYCWCYQWRKGGSNPTLRLFKGKLAREQCAPVLAKLDASDGASPSPASSPLDAGTPKPLPAPQPMAGNAPPKPLDLRNCSNNGWALCPEAPKAPTQTQAGNSPPAASPQPAPASQPSDDGLPPPNLTQAQEQWDAAHRDAPPPAPTPTSPEYQKAMQELDDAVQAEEHARAAAEDRRFRDSLNEHHTPNPPGGIQPNPAIQARPGAGGSDGSSQFSGLRGFTDKNLDYLNRQIDHVR